MGVYILILITVWVAWFVSRTDRRYQHIVSLMLIILISIIAALRYNVGMDYLSYDEIFNSIKYGNGNDIEPGFYALCRFVNLIGGTSQLMFLVCSIFTLLIYYKAFRFLSNNIVLTLSVFILFGQMYLNTFNAIRQCVAIAIFCYSIKFIIEKKCLKYLFCIIVASLFHMTALLLIPLYWILTKKWNFIVKIFILLVSIYFLPNFILLLISNSSYASYLTFEKFSTDASFINYLYIVVGAVIMIFEKKLLLNFQHRNILFNINFISLILSVLFIVFSGTPMTMVVVRLNYYFIIFYAVMVARILSDIKKTEIKLICELGIYVIFSILFIRTTLIYGVDYNLLPYEYNINLIRL